MTCPPTARGLAPKVMPKVVLRRHWPRSFKGIRYAPFKLAIRIFSLFVCRLATFVASCLQSGFDFPINAGPFYAML